MVASLTGAGDCLVGGTLASVCAGLDILQSLAVGIAVAKIAVEIESNVPSHCNVASITDDAKKILFAVKELAFDRFTVHLRINNSLRMDMQFTSE
ncbi:hypothetical protein QJS10_CPA07g01035 [Acorus calamus]|uniref:Carbohydrate kinase PfkB domain-containing protein n=1 Tax=Acorus calamus TaxID=4465 RepID=A0AAV9EFQ7_ACOCL|nr:hypothetical protein QJS10_CPA07g01035 [Acorus calamus]